MLKRRFYCTLTTLIMLVSGLMIPLSNTSPAYASSQLPYKPATSDGVYQTYQQPGQVFFDPNWRLLFTATGYLTLGAAYVTNPPTLNQQQMQVNISQGEFYDVLPNTYDAVYTYSGSLIGDYYITGGGCIAGRGLEDSTICGSNYATVKTSNYPIIVQQFWLADDSGLFFSGYWTVHPNLQ